MLKYIDREINKIEIELINARIKRKNYINELRNNFELFAKEFFIVRTNKNDFIPMEINVYQKYLLNKLEGTENIIKIHSDRQSGFSVFQKAYVCWLLIFHPQINIACVFEKLLVGRDFIAAIRSQLGGIADYLDIKFQSGNSFIKLGNNILQIFSRESTFCGFSIDLCIFDNTHNLPFENYNQLIPCLSKNVKYLENISYEDYLY